MGKKNRRKNKKKSKKQRRSEPASDSKRNTMVVGAALLVLVIYWGSTQLGGSSYPPEVAGYFYEGATYSPETGRVTVPEELVEQNKMVFVDLKLENPVDEFTYIGREIILTTYRGGEYLPLIVIETPKGETFSGIRTCEPCSGFSFHIVQGKYLSCDACGTLWDIETLRGVSGGCLDYPPPRLTTGLLNGIVIDVGSTGLDILA
jgi:hypothetical protein